jgi:hypothetical protein
MRWVHLFNRHLCRWVWTRVPAGIRIAAFSGVGLCSGGALWLHHAPTASPGPAVHRDAVPHLSRIGLPPPWGYPSGGDLPVTPCEGAVCASPSPPFVLVHGGPPPLPPPAGGGDPLVSDPGPVTTLITSGQPDRLPEPGSALVLTFGASILAAIRRHRVVSGR